MAENSELDSKLLALLESKQAESLNDHPTELRPDIALMQDYFRMIDTVFEKDEMIGSLKSLVLGLEVEKDKLERELMATRQQIEMSRDSKPSKYKKKWPTVSKSRDEMLIVENHLILPAGLEIEISESKSVKFHPASKVKEADMLAGIYHKLKSWTKSSKSGKSKKYVFKDSQKNKPKQSIRRQ